MASDAITFAALGDIHGRHRAAARMLRKWERREGRSLDFTLQVGDFEPHRHEQDLRTMDAPSKYKELGDFPRFYKGPERYPCPVYFIGGNHEPHGWLEQHPEGFELIEGCHYLGWSGAHEIARVRVAYLSGIFDPERFTDPRPPIECIEGMSNREWIRFTEADVERALGVGRADVLVVHEWPDEVISPEEQTQLGAMAQRKGIRPGNPWARMLMEALEPALVLAGHMHLRYVRQLELTSGHPLTFAGLGHVRDHEQALAVFEWSGGQLTQLP